MRYLLWAVSFFIPVAGFVIGVVYLQRPDRDSQRFARTSLILAACFLVVMCLAGCLAIAFYFVTMVLMSLAPFFLLPPILGPSSWLALSRWAA